MLRCAMGVMEFIAAFGVCLGVGMYIDHRRGGGTGWTLGGAAVGFAAGMYLLIQLARQYHRDMAEEDDQ